MAAIKLLTLTVVLAAAYHHTTGDFGGDFGGQSSSYAHPTGPEAEQGGYDHGGHGAVDYVAYPKYNFNYAVTDQHTGDSKSQRESRDGNNVVGEYELKEPGGNVRTVKYTSDEKGGFFAQVINNGGNDHSGGQGYGYGHEPSHAHSHVNFQGPVVGPAHPVTVHGGGHGY